MFRNKSRVYVIVILYNYEFRNIYCYGCYIYVYMSQLISLTRGDISRIVVCHIYIEHILYNKHIIDICDRQKPMC